jgi:hypothetical protein
MILDLILGMGQPSGGLITDLFNAQVYSGNASIRTIVTDLDEASGALVWSKAMGSTAAPAFADTVQGVGKILATSSAAPQVSGSTGVVNGFLSNGHSFSAGVGSTSFNSNLVDYVNWTFRKAPKFMDIVTYTGNGANRTIPHNLGVAPGFMLIKRLDGISTNWMVYGNYVGASAYMVFNTTAGAVSSALAWNSTSPTDTVFSLGSNSDVNTNSGSYQAYLFANDELIKCGSAFANVHVNLGWPPQFLLYKNVSVGDWIMIDEARGSGNKLTNAAAVEAPQTAVTFDSTGFTITTAGNYQYLAIKAP